MKRYVLAHRNGFDGLKLETDAPVPELRTSTDILVRIKALSLNARDIQIAKNDYPAPHAVPEGVVPVSDGAGIVEAVGSDVTEFKVGDRIAPVFPQGHYYEEDLPLRCLKRGLGGAIDGVAAEYFVCDEAEAVRIPSNYSFADAATMPVACATAWSSLYAHHPKLKAGETVLCLGTGGVSLCAAQIALVAGARVIVTSSSQSKLDKVVSLLKPLVPANAPDNVIQTIDYGKIDAWDEEARRMTHGKGVDFVIEIGGRATLARSVRSTKRGGLVAISGYMGDYASIPDHIVKEDIAKTILYSAASVRGVFVCNREELKEMSSALEAGGVKPIIDKVFTFDQLQEAYEYVDQGKQIGKVCIEL
ncbi:hypothetical protein IAU60_003258 [Kwoniella sp. DSM 27419]